MTKMWWAPGDLRLRAAAFLRAGLLVGLAVLPVTAWGVRHPVRPEVVHHATSRRAVAQTAKRRAVTKKTSAGKTKSVSRRAAVVVVPKSRDKKLRPQAVAAGRPAAEPKRYWESLPAATGAVPEAETLARGESHPEDDERLPVNQQVVATVSAAPEPVTPAGKATLPEKLHSAAVKAEMAKADTTSARGRAKPSVFPEDHAARAAVIEQATTPMILPSIYTKRGKLIVPPPMKGSRDILVHQNTMADNEGLDRIQDDYDLDEMRAKHLLVPLAGSASLVVNSELPVNRRYARPWTARFAVDTARAFYSRFHQPLRLNSAVRTVEYQIRLQRTNGNAAAVEGDGASPHLTGQALDFGKRGMSVAQIAWMRAYLMPLMQAGKLDVEEEFQQACFHVSVYRSYVPAVKVKAKVAPKVEVAQLRESPVVRGRR